MQSITKITKQTVWKEKNGIYAVYCNYHLTFLKGNSAYYFTKILNGSTEDVPTDFIAYLAKKGIVHEI